MSVMLRDVMTKNVLTTSPGATVADAAKAMTDRKIGSACVVDEQGRLLGIITERDVLRAAGSGRDLVNESVTEWMTPDPITIGPDEMPCSEIANIMMERGFRHLPILDGDALIGIVSMRDVWRFSFLPSEPDDVLRA
ncbi:MAG: CBS domain-containing protein [Actinomycetota bacterium]|nr:CBS domain-containing protein [Actinomycetota bacterium]